MQNPEKLNEKIYTIDFSFLEQNYVPFQITMYIIKPDYFSLSNTFKLHFAMKHPVQHRNFFSFKGNSDEM